MDKIRLLDICDVYQPKTISTKEFIENGKYPVYGANGAIGFYDKYNHEESEILMACRGASCGTINVSVPFSWINGNAMVIKPKENVLLDRKYLQYCLMSTDKKNIISGTAQPQITRQNMSGFYVSICDINEQKKIVEKVEELFSKLESGIATLLNINRQLQLYRQSVIKKAFNKCRKTARVESVCAHVTDGDHMPPPKAPEGIPFIMISNVHDNKIDWENTAFVGMTYFNSINEKRKPQKGDVLYTVTGSFGIPILIDYEKQFCFQRHIALLRPNTSIDSKYLYYAMQEPSVYAQASRKATGTAQKTVGLAVLRKIEIPFVDSLEVQKSIVVDIESKLSVCDSIEKTINDALKQADAMRHSILNSAFEGRLV